MYEVFLYFCSIFMSVLFCMYCMYQYLTILCTSYNSPFLPPSHSVYLAYWHTHWHCTEYSSADNTAKPSPRTWHENRHTNRPEIQIPIHDLPIDERVRHLLLGLCVCRTEGQKCRAETRGMNHERPRGSTAKNWSPRLNYLVGGAWLLGLLGGRLAGMRQSY